MKLNNRLKISSLATMILLFASAFSTANAQTANPKNVIQEVKMSSNDGFNELRNLVVSNFDFTNPNLTEEEIDTVVKFNIAKDGEITHVNAEGECKYVSREIVEVMENLQYKLNTDKIRFDTKTNTFMMPIKVYVASR